MIESIAAGASNNAQLSSSLKQASGNTSKMKLDMDSVPENKLKIDSPSDAGNGKGLVLDLQA